MKKINCYSKIASLICLVIFLISLIVGILPFFLFKAQEAKIFIAVWIIIFAFNILFSAFCFFHYRQYLYVKNGKIILRNTFFKIKELDINDCYYEVSRLLSQYGRGYMSENWICIYTNKETKFFKYGFTNSNKYERIQLIYTEENYNYIKNILNQKHNYLMNEK